MNGTPRSAIRRASRQLSAKVPGFVTSGPYMSRVLFGSLAMSTSSGTEVCMRNAISYWAMRAGDFGIGDGLEPPLIKRREAVEQSTAAGRC